jgi:hypothetical protein
MDILGEGEGVQERCLLFFHKGFGEERWQLVQLVGDSFSFLKKL